jgi:hypothetical protein
MRERFVVSFFYCRLELRPPLEQRTSGGRQRITVCQLHDDAQPAMTVVSVGVMPNPEFPFWLPVPRDCIFNPVAPGRSLKEFNISRPATRLKRHR